MIAQMTRVYVRRYRDNGQVTAYAEWQDTKGRTGRTEGPARRIDHPHWGCGYSFGSHMHALFERAKREGLTLERETW